MNYKLYKTINDIKVSSIQEGEDPHPATKDLYELWQLCFEDSDLYTDFYFKWKVNDNQILSIYSDNRISSMLHLNPYTLRVKGRVVNANYIVGVATREEDRRQGLMKTLLEEALNQMYEDKMEFTYLMPASEDIYNPFDFRVVYEQEPWNELILNQQRKQSSEVMINNQKESFIDQEESSIDEKDFIIDQQESSIVQQESFIDQKYSIIDQQESIIDIVILEESDKIRLHELVQFTNAVLSKQADIYVERFLNYYIRLLKEMHSCYGEVFMIYEQGKLVGYVSYMAEEKIYITEMIYLPEKREKVLQAVSNYFEDVIKKEMHQREAGAQKPAIMARIVNWKAFIKNITATSEMELIIKVTDPILKQNNGVYSLHFTKQGCTCKLSQKQPEIDATISDLTLLLFGKMDREGLEDLINKGNENISNEILNAVIEKVYRIHTYNKLFINDVV